MRRLSLAVAALALSILPARAGWLEIALQADAIEASGGAHLGGDPNTRFALGGRALFRDDIAGDTKLGGVVARFEAGADSLPGLEFGVGFDALFGEIGNADIGAAPIGVEATYAPASWRGLFVGGRLAYAPGILSWSDTQSLLEWGVRGGYRINPKIQVFGEYRRIEVDFEGGGSADADDTLKIGFYGRF